MQIESKTELRNVVRSAVKDFINAHPEALEKKWIESVTKRVTGQLYCHYVHNKQKDGKTEDFLVVREFGREEPYELPIVHEDSKI